MISFICQLRTRALVLLTASLLAFASHAGSTSTDEKHDAPLTELRANGMAALWLATPRLAHAKIVAADGLTVILDGSQAFTLDTLTASALGDPGADLTRLPDFMLGKVGPGDMAKSLQNELPGMRKMLLESNAVTDLLPVKLEGLSGAWLKGPVKSVIYLTDRQSPDFVTLITTVNMSDEAIRKIILEGMH